MENTTQEEEFFWPFSRNAATDKKALIERVAVSEATTESWKNDKVRRARMNRQKVSVRTEESSKEYKSVQKAFEELNLPLSRVQRFRKALKHDGVLDFKHDNIVYCFEIVT